MKIQKIIVLFVLFTCTSFASLQSQSDSLQVVWEDETLVDTLRLDALKSYYKRYNKFEPDATLKAMDYYSNLAKEKNNLPHIFHAANGIGNIQRLKSNYDQAMTAYLEAKEVALELKDLSLQAIILGNIGNVYVYKKDYQQATRHFSNALALYQEQGDLKNESRMLTNIGSVFLIIKNNELASEYYQKALTIINKLEDVDRNMAFLNLNIGWTHFDRELYSKAEPFFEQGLKKFQDENDKFFIASAFSALARTNHKLNNLAKANDYAHKSLALSTELGVKDEIVRSEITIAEIAFERDVEDATHRVEVILNELPKDTEKEAKRDLYQLLYQCYKSQNKLEQSLEMHESYTLYNDSIQLERNSFAVAREAVKNDFELRLKESKIESDKEKTVLQAQQGKRTIWIVSTFLLLIASLLYFFLSKIRKENEEKQLLLKEVEGLKNIDSSIVAGNGQFKLNRDKIEAFLERKINETDWKVLNILLDDPVIPNKDIAQKAFMSTAGIGSSLRRMYDYFEVKESKYKKISLLMLAIKVSR